MNILKAFLFSIVFISSYSMADVAVIVNLNNSSDISEKDISRIFLGKNKKFSNGQSVSAMNSKSSNPIRGEFESKVLGKSSKQVKAYWSKLIFSGKAKPLAESASDDEAIKHVVNNPGAIAYIDASKVNDTIKVVKVFK